MGNYNNRDGAKQENFDKAGKNLFKNINQKKSNFNDGQQKSKAKPFG